MVTLDYLIIIYHQSLIRDSFPVFLKARQLRQESVIILAVIFLAIEQMYVDSKIMVKTINKIAQIFIGKMGLFHLFKMTLKAVVFNLIYRVLNSTIFPQRVKLIPIIKILIWIPTPTLNWSWKIRFECRLRNFRKLRKCLSNVCWKNARHCVLKLSVFLVIINMRAP